MEGVPWEGRRDGYRQFLLPSLAIVLVVVLAATLAAIAALPAGADHVVDRAVLEDEAGTLSIGEVTAMDFAPMPAVLTAGYTASTHWIRLTVRAPSRGDRLILRIRPAFLDQITLFEPTPDAPGGWRASVTGDTIAFDDRPVPSASLALQIAPAEPLTVYYLRLRSTSTSMLDVAALEPHAFRQAEARAAMLLLLFLVAIGGILSWTLADLASRPDRVTLLFAISLVIYMAYVLAMMGYGAVLLPARLGGMADGLTSLMVCITPFILITLHRTVFVLFAPARLVDWLFYAMTACAACEIALYLGAGKTQLALEMNSYLFFFSSLLFIILAFLPGLGAERLPIVLKTLYLAEAATMAITMGPLLGMPARGEWVMQYTYILGLTYATVMLVFLQRRSRDFARRSRENKARLELVSQALGAERRQRSIQDRFVAMLIHEIRTPLSVIRLSLDRPSMAPDRYRDIDEALRDMDAIVERCSLAEQVESDRLPVHAERLDVADVLREAAERHAPAEAIVLDASGAHPVESDRHMMNVIVSNLIDNAMKYSLRGTPVAVSTHAADRGGEPGVLIVVANAIGRAGAPDPAKVFEKFYRAPGARAKVGSGLGLYIVRGLADLLGGTVECIVVGDGVRFEVWLPRRLRPAPPPAQVDARAGASEDGRHSLFRECLP